MGSKVIVSPAGSLQWAKVCKPGVVNRGKPGEREQWSCDLLLEKSDAEAQAFVKQLKAEFVERHGNAARPGPNGLPFKTHLDQTGEETNLWQFRFARNVVTSRGHELSPPLVQDAAGTLWPRDVLIGNGSTGKVAFDIWHWSNPEAGRGISLNLQGVRVLYLVEYQAPDVGEAFGEPEAGYVLTGEEKRTAPQGQAAAPAATPAAALDGWPDDSEEVPF